VGAVAASASGNRQSWHREEREAVRGGPASANGTGEDAGKVAVEPTLGEKLLHGAKEPVAAVAIAETLFEKRFEDTGSAVTVIPDEVLGVKPGPILFQRCRSRIRGRATFRFAGEE
jgi:hypothetical protein